MAHWTGEYQYTINQVLEEMIDRCRELDLRLDRAAKRGQARRAGDADGPDHELSPRRPSPGSLMKKLRMLVLMHEDLVPPDTIEGHSDKEILSWKTEYDVMAALEELGHEVTPAGRERRPGRDPQGDLGTGSPTSSSICWRSSTAWPSTTSTWSATWS